MIDTTQVLLILVIIILTIMLCVIGVQVYFILKQLKKSVDKLNRVLDNAEDITENIGKPVVGVTGILAGVREGINLFNALKKKKE